MSKREWVEENRESWNAATKRHNSHKGDQAAFLRDGGSTLFPEEVEFHPMLGVLDGSLSGDWSEAGVLHLSRICPRSPLCLRFALRSDLVKPEVHIGNLPPG